MSTTNLVMKKPAPSIRRAADVGRVNRPELYLVPALTKQRLSWPVWFTVAAMLVLALVIPVVINTQMAVTSYAMYSQEQELSTLLDYQADLVTKTRESQSPQYLAAKAKEIGLVPAGEAGYITLSEGKVTPGNPPR